MPELSPTLSLPYLQPAQAQKHVTHNEALRILDAVTQLSVITALWPTPPFQPADGDRYLVAGPATDAWVGQENTIAVWAENAWAFYAPAHGWRVDVQTTGEVLRFDGLSWVAPAVGALQNVPQIGVNTTADGTNRLSVSAAATLLNNAGNGHQLKLNKAAAGDTASLLFQTGFSGRAEMGTAGTDSFEIKVSADGNAFETALRIDESTGLATTKKRFFRAGLLTDQTGIADQTSTVVAFDSAPQNDGSMLNTANGQLTPPAGAVSAVAGVHATGLSANGACSIAIRKNGSILVQKACFADGAGGVGMDVTMHDVCTGTDEYEVAVSLSTGGAGTLGSNASDTYFNGFHH